MKIIKYEFFISIFIFSICFARQDDYYKDLSAQDREIAKEMEYKYLGHSHEIPLRFKGDDKIVEGQYVESDVIILNGTLIVAGEVRGTVLAIFADVELDSSAVVTGDVVSVDGKVWRRKGSKVIGDIVETEAANERSHRVYRGMQKKEEDNEEYERKERSIRYYENIDAKPVWANYNRVDGWTFGMKLPESEWWQRHNHNFALIGKGGYSFASKWWQYQIGLEHGLFDDNILALGGECHNMTDTQDHWIISDEENSFAAAVLKEDFQDYYKRTGYSFYGVQKLAHSVDIKAEYRFDDFSNLVNHTNWAMFGKHKTFRDNPMALPYGFSTRPLLNENDSEALRIRSFCATLTIDTRDRLKQPTQGWYIQAFGERAGYELTSDLEFERAIVDVRKYIPMGWDENLNIRLRAGSARGVLPPMYWFDLGGISTLRGSRFKELTGDRMVLANAEYRISTGDAWFLSHQFDIVLFVDSGYAWFANEETPAMLNTWPIDDQNQELAQQTMLRDSFDTLTWSDLKTSVGIGLEACNGDFRVDFAKKTDGSGNDIIITARITRSF
jgi:hypothetical protein